MAQAIHQKAFAEEIIRADYMNRVFAKNQRILAKAVIDFYAHAWLNGENPAVVAIRKAAEEEIRSGNETIVDVIKGFFSGDSLLRVGEIHTQLYGANHILEAAGNYATRKMFVESAIKNNNHMINDGSVVIVGFGVDRMAGDKQGIDFSDILIPLPITKNQVGAWQDFLSYAPGKAPMYKRCPAEFIYCGDNFRLDAKRSQSWAEPSESRIKFVVTMADKAKRPAVGLHEISAMKEAADYIARRIEG